MLWWIQDLFQPMWKLVWQDSLKVTAAPLDLLSLNVLVNRRPKDKNGQECS